MTFIPMRMRSETWGDWRTSSRTISRISSVSGAWRQRYLQNELESPGRRRGDRGGLFPFGEHDAKRELLCLGAGELYLDEPPPCIDPGRALKLVRRRAKAHAAGLQLRLSHLEPFTPLSLESHLENLVKVGVKKVDLLLFELEREPGQEHGPMLHGLVREEKRAGGDFHGLQDRLPFISVLDVLDLRIALHEFKGQHLVGPDLCQSAEVERFLELEGGAIGRKRCRLLRALGRSFAIIRARCAQAVEDGFPFFLHLADCKARLSYFLTLAKPEVTVRSFELPWESRAFPPSGVPLGKVFPTKGKKCS